jgi:hypothetical protein
MAMTEEQLVELVRAELRKHRPGGASLDVGPGPIRRQEEYWYVPVIPSVEPPKTFEYYEALAEVESDLEEREQIQVLLVPTYAGETTPAGETLPPSRGAITSK